MEVLLLVLCNLLIGSLIRTTFYRRCHLSEVKEHLIYRRILFIILWFLCIVSYVMQVSLILTTEYKLAMCMNIICVFSIMGLNNTVYSIGNRKKYI